MNHFRGALVGVGIALWSSVALAEDTTGKAPADARLERKIEARLERDGKLAARQLDAQANGGNVVLIGRVASDQDRARAEALAQVKGVKTVENQLVVEAVVPATDATPASRAAVREAERRALSDPQRKNPQVGSEPFRTKGSREEFIRSTGLEDPKQKKQNADTSIE